MSELWDPTFRFERRRLPSGVEVAFRHGGSGPPLLLLHGFPQTHAIWHRVAPLLAPHYTLVMADLRGYGDSSKPPSDAQHLPYSKRALAQDLVELMRNLGHGSFYLCGHDRGGRVSHRLALDHPGCVRKLIVLDISPTATMYERTGFDFAQAYYHWFFLTQPAPLPERLIGAEPSFYLRTKLGGWGTGGLQIFDPRALAEYERCFTPEAIHTMCEDYRASASIDLEHDRADVAAGRLLQCPLRVLWGARGVVNRLYTPVADWQAKCALPVEGHTMPGGHYIPEESPELLASEIQAFFGS